MDLSTRYEPAQFEGPIYAEWEGSGCFRPRSDVDPSARSAPAFSVVIPPPNVTGVLHMGHALNSTVQDIVIRHRRKLGYDTLWIPGTDHAGIATQAVVEKKLYQEQKLTREALGREAFVAKVWEWKEQHGNIILEQFRRLGCSCDWSRCAFTMDEDLSSAVSEAFVRLWEKGLIYRGARLVNWDCVLKTAVSDDEIDHVRQKGKLWHLRYPLEGKPDQHIVVATTRPETMLGDTGIAVHPEDERYRHLLGTKAILPFLERPIPIVADESVDPAYGSGAVKITPGHDPADYERGARHKLPIVNVLEKDGRISENGGPFAGLSREEARKRIVAELERMGLLEKVEDIEHNLTISDRSKSAIEPLVSEQWFVKMRPLAEPALDALRKGYLRFRPERWGKVYTNWLENVQDWCISRQLWWGHRIPVWYDEDGVPVASRTELELGSPHPRTHKPIVRRDEDVLDTWASSWLWPIATMGWPDLSSPDLRRFYPTGFLSTAQEIIYLWVARMVMAGYAFMPERPEAERNPFATCYINATVLDAKGRRMSKSLGNGIDPLEMIAQYGADAVRFSLILLTKEGQDVRLSPDRFEQGARFCNKVWNAARFVLMNLGEQGAAAGAAAPMLEDRWILSRLARTREQVGRWLDDYAFHDAASELYRFVWNDFCDWYLEIAKTRLTGSDPASRAAARETLVRTLSDVLGLLHPFTPFITEKLWAALGEVLGREQQPLVLAAWPDGAGLARDEEAEREMGVLQGAVVTVRRIRALTMVGERKPLAAIVRAPRPEERSILERHAAKLEALACLESLAIHAQVERPRDSAVAVSGAVETYVPLGAEVDLGKLREVLGTRLGKVRAGVEGAEKKLQNQAFLERADPGIVAEERERLEELQIERDLLERNLSGLGG